MSHQPNITILGPDPQTRTHRINANSFQQNALTTINSHQYAAFYTPNTSIPSALSVNLARRPVGGANESSKWESFAFSDYEQVIDDGHNTISIGICEGDGTIHVAFDQHCSQLNFRISKLGVASEPGSRSWDKSLFLAIRHDLPGLEEEFFEGVDFEEVSYPRFVNVGKDLLLSFRIGKAGAGSEILYHYSSTSHTYTYTSTYLTGISNNPYINGLTYDIPDSGENPAPNLLHTSWTYRAFLDYEDDGKAHKVQAGPNGPENNYDLCYAYSKDLGATWFAGRGGVEGEVGNTILPSSPAQVFAISKGSGILNQESQCVDPSGRIFVLNRELNRELNWEDRRGKEDWVVYWRGGIVDAAPWHATPLTLYTTSPRPTPTPTGQRGSIASDRAPNSFISNNLWMAIQDNLSSRLFILKLRVAMGPGSTEEEFSDWQGRMDVLKWEVWWSGEGYDGEPLIDERRLVGDGVLSVFTRTDDGGGGGRDVVVLDWDVGAERWKDIAFW